MKLVIIGVGQAGGKILDRLLEYDTTRQTNFIQHAVAINTAKTDLMGLSHVPETNKLLVGQTTVKGHGTGTNPTVGERCAREHIDEIQSAIDQVATTDVDAFLVIAGLGGGTGSGGAPVIAERVKELYIEPVYGLGILPATEEGGIYNRNAADSLQKFVAQTDNVLLFDNGAFATGGESLEEGFAEINEEITTRFGTLFSAGEIDALGDTVAESVVDSSEIMNTLGEDGLTSIGYASEGVDLSNNNGLLSRFKRNNEPDIANAGDHTNRITSLVRRATLGTLTLPCNIDSTSRALLIVSGPPDALNRKGIERARKWLEETTYCPEVRAGDYPLPNEDRVAVLVVLSGVTDVPRIENVQELATDAAAAKQERASQAKQELQDLIEYGNDE